MLENDFKVGFRQHFYSLDVVTKEVDKLPLHLFRLLTDVQGHLLLVFPLDDVFFDFDHSRHLEHIEQVLDAKELVELPYLLEIVDQGKQDPATMSLLGLQVHIFVVVGLAEIEFNLELRGLIDLLPR